MSEPIKKGDVAMVVRGMPCCGGSSCVSGKIGTVESIDPLHIVSAIPIECELCGAISDSNQLVVDMGAFRAYLPMIMKLDPPEYGDSLPTRKELEITQ